MAYHPRANQGHHGVKGAAKGHKGAAGGVFGISGGKLGGIKTGTNSRLGLISHRMSLYMSTRTCRNLLQEYGIKLWCLSLLSLKKLSAF